MIDVFFVDTSTVAGLWLAYLQTREVEMSRRVREEKVRKTIEKKLLKAAVLVKTGNEYYDKSYKGLVEAAQRLRKNPTDEDAAVQLAHGITGWNGGFRHAKHAASLIKKTASGEVKELLEFLDVTATDDGYIEGSLRRAKDILGIRSKDSITVASKLLHFLYPNTFPMMDRNVAKKLGHGSPSLRLFIDYVAALWNLEFNKTQPADPKLSHYWITAKKEGVSPLRIVDCTLWAKK